MTQNKCEKYWPSEGEALKCDEFVITLESQDDLYKGVVRRKFKIEFEGEVEGMES